MKIVRYFIFLLLWSSAVHSFTNKSFLTYRSQGFNFARNNSGWLHRCDENNASATIGYGRSFDSCALANYFFGASELVFSGSRRTDRGEQDILADYYGLPTDFKSVLRFDPKIKNVMVDFDFYRLLDCGDCKRFSFRVNAPVVRSTWSLNPCEEILEAGVFDYPAGYMSKDFMSRSELEQGALGVLSGQRIFGDLIFPLQYGRIVRCTQSLTKLSDIFVEFNYLAVCRPCTELAIGLHVVAPTGTSSQAVNLFEAQVGNGKHWALGGSFTGRYDFVNNDARDLTFSAHLDVYVQHLFKKTQKRSYDLVHNGPGSRYMLMMDMIGSISQAQGFVFTPPFVSDLIMQQYITRLLYVVDATTLNSTIKINAQVDLTAKFSASYCHWSAEVGYNVWARSAETLVCREQLWHKFYGIKGDAQLYGYLPFGDYFSIPINATQSQATIHAPQPNGNTTNNFINSNADHAALLYNVGVGPMMQTNPVSVGANTGVSSIVQINGSNQAIVVTDADINNCSALSPRAFSQSLFGSVRYEWQTCRTNPYLLVGAQGEWSGKVDCAKTAVSQWGVWLKGGVNY